MKNFLIILLLVISSASCKKENHRTEELIVNQYATLIEVKQAMMQHLLIVARKSPEFRKLVENECLKQVRGDYNVSLDRLIELDKLSSVIPQEDKAVFYSLTKQMKQFRNGEMPIVFVPIMENRDPKYITKLSRSMTIEKYKPSEKITIVDQDGEVSPFKLQKEDNPAIQAKTTSEGKDGLPEGCVAPYYYPGYILDNYGNLTYSDCINFEMAWETDVWVLGYEEDVHPDNMQAHPNDVDPYTPFQVNSTRYNGNPERLGLIQILDLSQIEPWTRGKPEFIVTVHDEFGTQIYNMPTLKWRRKHFHNQQWFNYNLLLGSWNVAQWGNIQYESWISDNGGPSTPYTSTISYNSNGVTYSTTISVPRKERDIFLGMINVQFTDQPFKIPLLAHLWYKYTFYNMNMYRISIN